MTEHEMESSAEDSVWYMLLSPTAGVVAWKASKAGVDCILQDIRTRGASLDEIRQFRIIEYRRCASWQLLDESRIYERGGWQRQPLTSEAPPPAAEVRLDSVAIRSGLQMDALAQHVPVLTLAIQARQFLLGNETSRVWFDRIVIDTSEPSRRLKDSPSAYPCYIVARDTADGKPGLRPAWPEVDELDLSGIFPICVTCLARADYERWLTKRYVDQQYLIEVY